LARYTEKGDAESLDLLIKRYERFVRAVCSRYVADAADVDDAVQETFSKLVIHGGDIRENMTGWLITCARNTSRTKIRREVTRKRHEKKYADFLLNRLQSQTDINESTRQELDDALLSLEEEDRQLIVSYFYECQSQADLAKSRGISQPGIKYRLDKALGRLKSVLGRRGVTDATIAGLTVGLAADAAAAESADSADSLIAIIQNVAPQHGPAASASGSIIGRGSGAFGGAEANALRGLARLSAGLAAVCLLIGVSVWWAWPSRSPPSAGGQISPSLTTPIDDGLGMPDPQVSRVVYWDPNTRWPPHWFGVEGDTFLAYRFDGRTLTVDSEIDTYRFEVAGDAGVQPGRIRLTPFDDEWGAGGIRHGLYRIDEERGILQIVVRHNNSATPPTRFPRLNEYARGEGYFDDDGAQCSLLTLFRQGLADPVPLNRTREQRFDPRLHGRWQHGDYHFTVFEPDRIRVYEAGQPDGPPVGEIEIERWQIGSAKTSGLIEGVWRHSNEPHISPGEPARFRYRADAGAGTFEVAFVRSRDTDDPPMPTSLDENIEGLIHRKVRMLMLAK